MAKDMSISITVGNPKPKSGERTANYDHNNREKLSPQAEKRIDSKRTDDNIPFIREPIGLTYEKLFENAISEYNEKLEEKQKSGKTKNRNKDRFIKDAGAYLDKIQNGKQEKSYYEAIIQFGDVNTTGFGSGNEDTAKKLLAEYMLLFQKRNPQLKVFNAVLHLDEATPHLHLDFVPWCDNPGKNGLSVKNSLTGALKQQGFILEKFNDRNAEAKAGYLLSSWIDSEKNIMAGILKDYGYGVDEKNANRRHQSVDEYIKDQKAKETIKQLNQDPAKVIKQMDALKAVNEKLKKAANPEYREYEIAGDEMRNAVCENLRTKNIPWIEKERFVFVPQYAENLVTDSIAAFKPQANYKNLRGQMKADIDKNILYAKDYNEFITLMKDEGYICERRGEYMRFRPPGGERFIRIDKSLGADYTEDKIKHRIDRRADCRADFKNKMEAARTDGNRLKIYICGTAYNVTTYYFDKKIQPRKHDLSKPYTHYNDRRIVKLVNCLNTAERDNITLENLQDKINLTQNRQRELITEIKNLKAEQSPQAQADGIIKKLEIELSGNKERLKEYLELKDFVGEAERNEYLDKIAEEDREQDDGAEKEMGDEGLDGVDF